MSTIERAAVVGFAVDKKGADHATSMEELKRLLETAGGEAVETVLKMKPEKDPATLIGKGKAAEIAAMVKEKAITLVVFDDDLSPGQQRHLEEIIPAKVIDRTRLILDIFAQRARTNEGKLQVELAQLNYLLPRVTAKFGTFEQQTGGIGGRGPGERKLEVDQRRIRERIARLKKEVVQVRAHRELQRKSRARLPLPVVALVGYTNAGKSTLLNALRAEGGDAVYADDKLFATLDPTSRRVKLPGGRPALFIDTVGFIQKLPHHLVDAFHATLESAKEADLLIHVVDASHPEWEAQRRVVVEVLKDLEADAIPQLLLYNKADVLTPAQRAAFAADGGCLASARSGKGLDAVLSRIEEHLESSVLEREFLLPHGRRDLLPLIHTAGRILKETPGAEGVTLRVRMDAKDWGHVRKELGLKE
jgi:GTP-binding protein HflX